MMVGPFVYLIAAHPDSIGNFLAFSGVDANGQPLGQGVSFAGIMLAAGVCLSLIAQIAEQIDYLRFMHAEDPGELAPVVVSRAAGRSGLGAVRCSQAGRGSVPGGVPDRQHGRRAHRRQPTGAPIRGVLHRIDAAVAGRHTGRDPRGDLAGEDQRHQRAYSGSLAWTNSYTRITKHYPGRLIFVVVNVLIALALMEADMFSFLSSLLNFYANCGIAWIVVVATGGMVNKYLLKISPKTPEFRRGMLYAVNPVGFDLGDRRNQACPSRCSSGRSALRCNHIRHWSPPDWASYCRRSWRSPPAESTTCVAAMTVSIYRCSTTR